VAMDEDHLAAASRYVAPDPARARLVERARDWRWSSVHAHLAAREDGVTTIGPALDRYPPNPHWGRVFSLDAAAAALALCPSNGPVIGSCLGARYWHRSPCHRGTHGAGTECRRLLRRGAGAWRLSYLAMVGRTLACRVPATDFLSSWVQLFGLITRLDSCRGGSN
jgi:hypothetical protein